MTDMNGFTRVTRFTGQRVTLDDLRTFVEKSDDLPGGTRVDITVAQRYDNPADPGGEICISVTGSEADQ